MIVTLTVRQIAIVKDAVPGLASCFDRDVKLKGTRMFVIRAPYVAWEEAKAALIDKWVTRAGNVRGNALSALRRIVKAQNAILRHPALRKMGMIGFQPGWFPVWELPEPDMNVPGGRWYSPSPVEGCRFTILAPIWHTYSARGRKWTTWGPDGVYPRDDWLADEREHLALRRS